MHIEGRVFKGTNTILSSSDIKYVHRIGVELEGAWDSLPENIHHDASIQGIQAPSTTPSNIPSEHNCHECRRHTFMSEECINRGADWCRSNHRSHCRDNCDRSDHCDSLCDKICGCGSTEEEGISIGECISAPSTIEQLRFWVANNAPDITNSTCSVHIHISMKKDIYYAKLMDESFFNYFLKFYEKWGEEMGFSPKHEFWKRLSGQNRYCKKVWQPDLQAIQSIKNAGGNTEIRRTLLNFCYGHVNEDGSVRKTFECRLFPAFNHAAYTMAAIESLVRCVETYLDSSNPSSIKLSSYGASNSRR